MDSCIACRGVPPSSGNENNKVCVPEESLALNVSLRHQAEMCKFMTPLSSFTKQKLDIPTLTATCRLKESLA